MNVTLGTVNTQQCQSAAEAEYLSKVTFAALQTINLLCTMLVSFSAVV
jgi:hypothetical protein